MHGQRLPSRSEEGAHGDKDLARLFRLAALRLRAGQVQPLRKAAQREGDRLPRPRVDLADLGRELDGEPAQAVDVPVRQQRRVRARGGNGVRHARGEHDFRARAPALGNAADEHGVEILRDERDLQPREPLREQRRELLRGKYLPARERLRLGEHAHDPLVPARGERGVRAHTLLFKRGGELFLPLFAPELFENGARGAAVLRARHGGAHALKCGENARAQRGKHEGLFRRLLQLLLHAAAEIRVFEKIVAVRLARGRVAAEERVAEEGVDVGGVEPLGGHREPAQHELRERVFRDAAAHVRIVRDLILAERLFEGQRVGGKVGHVDGDLVVAQAAVQHLALDRRGDIRRLFLRVRRRIEVHARRFERRAPHGIEQPAAKLLRLFRQGGGQADPLAAVPRQSAQPFEVAHSLVRVQRRLPADEHARNALRAGEGGADALRRLPSEGGKTRKIHVRLRKVCRAHGGGQQFEHAALVHVPVPEKGEVPAVDARKIPQFCREVRLRALRRAFERGGRDLCRAELRDRLVQSARTARGVPAETLQLPRTPPRPRRRQARTPVWTALFSY